MPRRIVVVRRWEVAVAFLLLTIVFVVSVTIATSAAHRAQDASNHNRDLIRRLNLTDKRLASLVQVLSQQRRIQVYDLCTDINAIKAADRKTLREGINEAAKLTYYWQHPHELARIRTLTQRRIAALRPRKCPPNPNDRPGSQGP